MLINWLLIKKTKCSKSIPGFSISRLAIAEDFFHVNIFFKCKYVRINDYSFKYVCEVCCLKKSLLLPDLFCKCLLGNLQKIKQKLSNTLRLNFYYQEFIRFLHPHHQKIIRDILKHMQKTSTSIFM